jgi:hypothetical protein
MYFYFGWLVLSCDCYEDDSSVLDPAIEGLKEFLTGITEGLGKIDIDACNGTWVMMLRHGSNRRPGQWAVLQEVLNYISGNLRASYGVIHEFTEDQALAPFPGDFSVIVMSRGQWRVERDKFLSPIVPTIFDR